MNKFKDKMNEIKMNNEDKNRILNNILDYENKKNNGFAKLKINQLLTKVAIFITGFCVVGGSAYAAVKVFNIDEKLSYYFGKKDEDLSIYGIGSTEIAKKIETENAIITINQTIVDEKEIYISLDVDSKTEAPIHLTDIKTSKEENNIFGNGSFGFTMLEERDNHTGYVLSTDIDGKIEEDTNITITLYMDDDTSKDIIFKVSKNEMKMKEVKTNKVVYDDGNIVAKVTSVRITPLHFIFDIEYNVDIHTIEEETLYKIYEELYNDMGNRNNVVSFANGKKYNFSLWHNGKLESMLNPYFAIKDVDLIDIDSVKSITINGIKLFDNYNEISNDEVEGTEISDEINIYDLKVTNVSKDIILNNTNYSLELQAVNKEHESEEETKYICHYSIFENRKLVQKIEIEQIGKVKEGDISKISDNNGKEYLLIYTHNYEFDDNITLFIIDILDNYEIVGKHESYGICWYVGDDDIQKDEPLKLEVSNDKIVDYKLNNKTYKLEKHEYTVENGKIKDTVVEEYEKYQAPGKYV